MMSRRESLQHKDFDPWDEFDLGEWVPDSLGEGIFQGFVWAVGLGLVLVLLVLLILAVVT